MFKKVIVNHLGTNDDSGKLVHLMTSNQKVQQGNTLASIETTKSIIDIEAPDSGWFYSTLKTGEDIFKEDVLGYISYEKLKSIEDIVIFQESEKLNQNDDLMFTEKAKYIIDKYDISINSNDSVPIIDVDYLKRNYPYIFEKKISKCIDVEKEIIIVGAGSAADLIYEHIKENGEFNIRYFVDYNDLPHKDNIENIEILGFLQLEELVKFGYKKFFIHLPSTQRTLGLMNELRAKGIEFINVVHKTASISTLSKIGVNNLIGPFAIIGPYVSIGDSCSVLNSASIAHHSNIHNGVRVSDGARVAGNVVINDFVLIGLNSTVNARVEIASEVTILSGASVYNNILEKSSTYPTPKRLS